MPLHLKHVQWTLLAHRLATEQTTTTPLPTYIAKFTRLLYEAGALDWADAAKISMFRAGLSQSIKDRLEVQLILPTTYPEFVATIKRLATTRGPGGPAAPATGVDPMQIGAVTVGTIITPVANGHWSESDSDS